MINNLISTTNMPTEKEIEQLIRKEEKIIEDFVKWNPYPNYQYIIGKLESDNKFLDMFAEYGELNHEFCKTIYENPNNEELIIEMGRNIDSRGGKWALFNNIRVLRLVFNENHMNHFVVKGYARIIEEIWSKVGLLDYS